MTVTFSIINPTEANTLCKTANFIGTKTTDPEQAAKAELHLGMVKYWQISEPEIFEVNLIGSGNQPLKFVNQLTAVKRQEDGYVFIVHSSDLSNTTLVSDRAQQTVGPMGDGFVFSRYDRQVIYRRASIGSMLQSNVTQEDILLEYKLQRQLHQQDIALFCRGLIGAGEWPEIILPECTLTIA